jgi:two-component system chemotaxis response regulator CheV
MSGILDSVNQRTQLVGQNRLELLLFRLSGAQVYGINVFKVKEVLQCPKLTSMPKSSAMVRGVAHIRGGTIPILDMGLATGQRSVAPDDAALSERFVIITEYNRNTQGFLVGGVERIVNLNWEEIHPPPKGSGRDNYLTAVTEIDGKLIEIIDVEKILAEVAPVNNDLASEYIEEQSAKNSQHKIRILVVDDSVVARKQIEHCLSSIGLEIELKNDGLAAYNHLREITADGSSASDHYTLMISDVEMPEMDGYTLTTKCKSDPALASLYVMLHTSLSGVFNQAMVKKVGADDFMAKFNADELTDNVMGVVDRLIGQQ